MPTRGVHLRRRSAQEESGWAKQAAEADRDTAVNQLGELEAVRKDLTAAQARPSSTTGGL